MAPGSDTRAPSGRTGTRRRGDALQDAIFAAALDQLGAVGYARLTMEGVAQAAGTGKAALYRRWPSKDDLITDTLRSVLPDPAGLRLTGEPRTDIMTLLRCMRDAAVLTHGTAFQVVKREGGPESGLSAMTQDRVLEPCQGMILTILENGVKAGLLRAGAASPRIAGVGPAMLIHRAITAGPEISDDYLASIVDEVVMPLILA
jgi:AcrR family transcriptional regulator